MEELSGEIEVHKREKKKLKKTKKDLKEGIAYYGYKFFELLRIIRRFDWV